jgi:hypothetical protein
MSNNQQEKFKKLLIFPKNLFDEWKKNVEDEKKFTPLDRGLKNIMKRKDLNDYQKWDLYKYQLLKHQKPKKQTTSNKQTIFNTSQTRANKKTLRSKINKVRQQLYQPQVKNDGEIQIENEKIFSSPAKNVSQNFSALNENDLKLFKSPKSSRNISRNIINTLPQLKEKEDIFENNVEEFEEFNNEHPPSSSMIVSDEMEVEYDEEPAHYDDDVEVLMHSMAQDELGAKHPNDIVRLSTSANGEYSKYLNKTTGENTLIEKDRAKDILNQSVYNEQNTSRLNQTPSRAPVVSNPKPTPPKAKSRAKKIHPPEITYPLRSKFKKAIGVKEFAKEEFLRKQGTKSAFDWLDT